MSELPGFTKLTSTPTKLRDLEMEDTFLQNLQVMNGGSTDFEMENSSLSFNSYEMNLFVGASHKKGIDIPTIYYSTDGINSAYNYNGFGLSIQDEEKNEKGTGVLVDPVSLSLQKYTYNAGVEEYFEIATTDQIIEQEGITKASDMNQASFWDADVVVPTGHTLTNEAGINASQITAGTLVAERIPSISASKINEGTFDVERIPNLNTSKITDLETTLGDYVTTSALTTTLENYVESSALSDYVTSSTLTTILSNYVEDSDLTTALSSYVTSTTLETTLTGYASLDTNKKIDVNAIPNLTASKISDINNYVLGTDLTNTLKGYASLDQNNKISEDAIPNLKASKITSETFALDRIPDLTTSKITDIETSYAKLSEGKISDDVIPNLKASKITEGTLEEDRIPDLGSTYAKLTNNKISENAIPDLSSTYASLTNSKISTSVIPNLDNSAGMTIDAGLIQNAPWKSTINLSDVTIDTNLEMGSYYISFIKIGDNHNYNTSMSYEGFDMEMHTPVQTAHYTLLPTGIYSSLTRDNINTKTTIIGGTITTDRIEANTNSSQIIVDTNLDLSNKNLTTTGTVTASNIPSST